MANLEDKVKEEVAQKRLVKSYGYIVAAQSIPHDKETGAMVLGGRPLYTEPYQKSITALEVAVGLMREEAKTNPALAQFMTDNERNLLTKDSIQNYTAAYQKYMQQSKLSDLVDIATSLGIKVNRGALAPYMNESSEDIQKNHLDKYEKKIKEGTATAEEKAKYSIIKMNITGLEREIANAYKRKVEEEAGKRQKKREDFLNNPKNLGIVTKFIEKHDLATKYAKEAQEAYAAGLETAE